MANFEATITVPPTPVDLRVMFPGRERGVRVPLSEFSETQLRAVSKEWGDALVAKRADQVAAIEQVSMPDPADTEEQDTPSSEDSSSEEE